MKRFLLSPSGWLVFRVVELIGVAWLVGVLVPDEVAAGVTWVILIAVVVLLFTITYVIRRRYLTGD